MSSVVVFGLEMSSRTNFESLALRVKSLVNSPGAPQSHTNYDMKAVKGSMRPSA